MGNKEDCRKYYIKHREEILRRGKEYKLKNKAHYNELSRLYYRKNRENVLKKHNEWVKKNRDHVNAERRKREAKKKRENPEYREKLKQRSKLYYNTYKARILLKDRSNNPKEKCRRAVMYAVKNGTLIRPEKCPVCGKIDRIQAHHFSYDKPLDIVWVCGLCHGLLHSK